MPPLWVQRTVNAMGDVLATFRIMPEGVEVDLGKLRKTIAHSVGENIKIQGMVEKPFAFGLKAIELAVILADMEGGTEKLEETIRKLEGVQSVENTGVTLV